MGCIYSKGLISASEQSCSYLNCIPKDLCDAKRVGLDGWFKILQEDTSVQNTRYADLVLQCARRIEFVGQYVDASQVSLEIWSLAETLNKSVIENFGLLQDHNFCNAYGKIACVPAEKNLRCESGTCRVKRVLCSYNDAILLKDWPLAWTVAPVLSNVPPDYSWDALQLRSPPSITLVLKHLQANTWRSESSLFTIEEASYEVLKYLDKIWETLSSSDILQLQELAFIAADNGTRLATPGSLFVHLSVNLSPLASILPSRYLPFSKILKELGVDDMLSVSSAINILSSLHKSCGCHRLNPNQLNAVIELLQFLCDESVEPQTSKRPGWESELVVPDDGCRLVRPKTCVYIDPRGSQYMSFIDSSKLKFVHHDVTERLCFAFGIRKLSDVVVEELDYVEHHQTLEEESVSLASIRRKLLSRSFQVAVSSVINNFSRFIRGSKNPDFVTQQRSLESVAKRLKFVQRIYTRFWLLPKFLDITETGSSHQALYYVDRSGTCILIAEPPHYVPLLDLVAIVVSRVLGSPVPLPIGSLLLCPPDSETKLVNTLKLSCNEQQLTIDGFLGSYLLPRDKKQVYSFHTFAPCFKGEIVAWKSEEGEKLKYGRILEDVKLKVSTEKLYHICKIETSQGMTGTFNNTHVFRFANYSTIQDCSSTHVESDNILSSMQIQQSQASQGLNLRNQRDADKELESGAEEFVQSVEDMFYVAGINMDVEKQCLLQTTMSLHKQLNESQASLVLDQEKLEMATREANAAKTAMHCRLCLSSEIDVTLVPCGHVLCRTCTSDVTHCPVCGVTLSKIMNLYWP